MRLILWKQKWNQHQHALELHRIRKHTLRSQQKQMQHAEHFYQGSSSKQHLYGLETSQSSHQSHHYEALDLCLQTKTMESHLIAGDITKAGTLLQWKIIATKTK
jgi:hypothetical protein